MPLPIRKALIVFFSPSGSTQHVADMIEKKIRSLEISVTTIDLGREEDIPFLLPQLLDAKDNICLFIASPVYASHPAPPVMEFISVLPKAEKGFSVPFVTWGGVTSGIALYRMGKALQEKGYALLGAAKVLARHSIMWACEAPLGENHPDADDDRMIEDLVERVNLKLKSGYETGLPLSVLAYQKEEVHAEMASRPFESLRQNFPPRQVDESRCNQCGVRRDQCPVQAISFDPYPVFGSSCVQCLNCVRLCPEKAVTTDLEPRIERIRARAKRFEERPLTGIFF
ncbi:MAG: EFR1 family ferrodoxin [Proteobacteria bacterium]|nr:EFR1 family ferrodoxin [Pseudomonadota bacterium]